MNGKRIGSVTTLFTLTVFLLFTILSLLLVLIGAKSYHGIVTGMESNQQTRTSLNYVSNKVHSAGAGEVSLQTVAGHKALVISSRYNQEDYRTYIYEYNGTVLEWFTRASQSFNTGAGDTITAVSGFSMEQNGQMLRLTATGKDGNTLSANVLLP